MEIKEYLDSCTEKLTVEEYLNYEKVRINRIKSKKITSIVINAIRNQNCKCYYCGTDIRLIQELIFNKIINPRKRGDKGFSGIHFEIDHKDTNKSNNTIDNLVASCYYCNNDKSNTISHTIFKEYFGPQKHQAFINLLSINNLVVPDFYRHNLNH